ncbi:MAG: 30S ribosome-binding factor RbfA [Bacteroidia bacterium]|nr:30S ribosome-binding factor RbfA [Bacteroidia bacterium]MCZ2141560.1 30S ribosome-binding factor RbfA [Bacteroidia bacterium]
MSIRQEKFARLIQKELAEVFMENRSAMFHNAFITISSVTVSPDLGYAKVYLSFLNEKNKEELLHNIEAHKVPIRRELAARIRKQVRVIPDLQFFIDDSLDYVFKMEQLFAEINKKDKES